MESLVVILGAIVGGAVGFILCDFRARGVSLAKLMAAETNFATSTKAISDAHNTMAEKLISLGDRVNAQELRLGSMANPQAPNPFIPRRG